MPIDKEERRFTKIAVEQTFLTQEARKECHKIQQKMAKLGVEPKTIIEILREKDYLTESQVLKVQQILGKKPGGRKIANFKILRKIDKGAMGTVYKAKQMLMDRVVALKVLSDKLAKDKEFKNRFIKEARAIGMLKHPNIIQGIDVGEWEGKMYFAMEFVNGETVYKFLKRGGKMDERRSLEIVLQIARALDYVHGKGLVHRDIKPDNIMISRETQEAKLCDLGLVKHPGYSGDTQEGRSLGTPNYISPEQARGEASVDIRSDLYSLGATLYHMVVGEVPFRGAPAVVMTKHLNDPFPDPQERNPELMHQTVQVILKLAAKNPDERYQTPKELIPDLEEILRGGDPFDTRTMMDASGAAPKTGDEGDGGGVRKRSRRRRRGGSSKAGRRRR